MIAAQTDGRGVAHDLVQEVAHPGRAWNAVRAYAPLALLKLAECGWLLSDDVHVHDASTDFCCQHDLPPTHLGSLGVTRKRTQS